MKIDVSTNKLTGRAFRMELDAQSAADEVFLGVLMRLMEKAQQIIKKEASRDGHEEDRIEIFFGSKQLVYVPYAPGETDANAA